MKKHRLINPPSPIMAAALGLSGLAIGYHVTQSPVQPANAQEPIVPTLPALPSGDAPAAIAPAPTPWAMPTPLPTATPWSAPVAWQPASIDIPTLRPLPVAPTAAAPVAIAQGVQGVSPVSYSPPDGIDVFGNGLLRWEYYGELAPDEWFDVKIKPAGSNDSVFVDWTKEKEYPLAAWSGWQPGLYTWQIGIVKGTKEGETKHFIEDTGRNSQPFLIKWQSSGGGDGGGNGGSGSSGGGGGGGNSGGS